jgi:hypothetical protein
MESAISDLYHRLLQAYRLRYMDAQHIVTTYSFSVIIAIFDLNCAGTDFESVLMRLQPKKDQIVG